MTPWSWRSGLNRRPPAPKAGALPLRYAKKKPQGPARTQNPGRPYFQGADVLSASTKVDRAVTLWPFRTVCHADYWSWVRASNPRPADYRSAALPAELPQRKTGSGDGIRTRDGLGMSQMPWTGLGDPAAITSPRAHAGRASVISTNTARWPAVPGTRPCGSRSLVRFINLSGIGPQPCRCIYIQREINQRRPHGWRDRRVV